MLTARKPNRLRQAARNVAAGTVWRIPGRFGVARTLDRSYSLRCVVFHNISISESPFTMGMGVSMTPGELETALRFLTRYYVPVRLDDVLDARNGRVLPPRAVLVTFDDGYASAVHWAAPLCHELGVPAIFFINGAFLGNQRLAPDNLVCYMANTYGMDAINAAVKLVSGSKFPKLKSLAEVFSSFFPAISLFDRNRFLEALIRLYELDEAYLASRAALYLTQDEVRELACLDCEIGNHTYTHVRCRCLTPDKFGEEIHRNKAELEALTGKPVRSFSVPYGSSSDLTGDVAAYLQLSGHQAVFLSESVANHQQRKAFCFDRVSTGASDERSLFFEIEILPRLRAVRNRLFGFTREFREGAFAQSARRN